MAAEQERATGGPGQGDPHTQNDAGDRGRHEHGPVKRRAHDAEAQLREHVEAAEGKGEEAPPVDGLSTGGA